MDLAHLIESGGFLWSPLAFAGLIGLATVLVWLALAPKTREVQERLDGYGDRRDVIQDEDMGKPFGARVLLPLLRRVLRVLGRLAPKGSVEKTREMLVQAGEPGGLTVLDFMGLRLLSLVLVGGGYFWLVGQALPAGMMLRNTVIFAGVGYMLPRFWLRRRVRQRQHEIIRAFPDALDMLTIGVEAGLAFESALLTVGERWDNALTREFRRAVAEMRVGTARDVALWRMAERTGVEELRSFVAVLVQSSQLGVSIAQVLHSQAAQERVRRRQRAEELARQAGGKIVFPLVFLILPAMFVVILGPAVPDMISMLNTMTTRPGR